MNSVHPGIKNAKFKIISRQISYDVLEVEDSITSSIYDKFLLRILHILYHLLLINIDSD